MLDGQALEPPSW